MKKKINNLLKKASNLSKKSRSKYFYPLLEDAFFEEDIFSAIEVLLSKKLTMGKITKKFEKRFCKFIGSKYAVMVNSGSSANLLALSSMNFKKGGEVLTTPNTWYSSVGAIIHNGLIPRFIDIKHNINSHLNIIGISNIIFNWVKW